MRKGHAEVFKDSTGRKEGQVRPENTWIWTRTTSDENLVTKDSLRPIWRDALMVVLFEAFIDGTMESVSKKVLLSLGIQVYPSTFSEVQVPSQKVLGSLGCAVGLQLGSRL